MRGRKSAGADSSGLVSPAVRHDGEERRGVEGARGGPIQPGDPALIAKDPLVPEESTVSHERCGAADGLSVPQVHVCTVDKPNQTETDSQEPSAQEIPQGSEVGDGEIIRIQCLPPHQAHN